VLDSLTAGTLSTSLRSPNFTYTQNLHLTNISSPESILSGPLLPAAYTHSIIDQDACAAFVKLLLSPPSDPSRNGNGNDPILVGMHLHYNWTASAGNTLTALHLVSAGPQDWQMGVAPDISDTLLSYLEKEDWTAISRARQDSRDVLLSVAGSYLDFLAGNSTSSGNSTVPWGRPCSRLDGGVYIAIGEDERCDKGIVTFQEGPGHGIGVTERSSFVVDESVGAVSVRARDGRLHDAASVFEVRVVAGTLRYVHQFASLVG
jgi:hypothetical protein